MDLNDARKLLVVTPPDDDLEFSPEDYGDAYTNATALLRDCQNMLDFLGDLARIPAWARKQMSGLADDIQDFFEAEEALLASDGTDEGDE